MDTSRSGPEIADHIRRKVIYEGLELEEIGIDLADVTDDVRLFDEDGLNLDSIDALEIVAGVQREFGLSLPNVDQAFIEEHCSTVGRLASMVVDRSRGAATRARAPGGAAGGETSGSDDMTHGPDDTTHGPDDTMSGTGDTTTRVGSTAGS